MQKSWNEYSSRTFEKKIEFLSRHLQRANAAFPGRVAIQRRINYAIGKAYEQFATVLSHPPLERSELFLNAATWYGKADELLGFLSDYAMEGAEAYRKAAVFRRMAGVDDELTRMYYDKGTELALSYYGGFLGIKPILIDKGFTDYKE